LVLPADSSGTSKIKTAVKLGYYPMLPITGPFLSTGKKKYQQNRQVRKQNINLYA
jgi:hypothetical protein